MELTEKARIRIEHWLKHNESHLNNYREFAEELESAGLSVSAGHIREMISWSIESNQCLNNALNALN
jgi:hypothetical protein